MKRYIVTDHKWEDFLLALLHGDVEHRQWLVEELRKFKAGLDEIPDWVTHFASSEEGKNATWADIDDVEEIPK